MKWKKSLVASVLLLALSAASACTSDSDGGSVASDSVVVLSVFLTGWSEQSPWEASDGTTMQVGELTAWEEGDEDQTEMLLRFDQDTVFLLDGEEVGSKDFYDAVSPDPLEAGVFPSAVEIEVDTSDAPSPTFYGTVLKATN